MRLNKRFFAAIAATAVIALAACGGGTTPLIDTGPTAPRFTLVSYDAGGGVKTNLEGRVNQTLADNIVLDIDRVLVAGEGRHPAVFAVHIYNATVTAAQLAQATLRLVGEGEEDPFEQTRALAPLQLAIVGDEGENRVWQHGGATVMRFQGESDPDGIPEFTQTVGALWGAWDAKELGENEESPIPASWEDGDDDYVLAFRYLPPDNFTELNLRHTTSGNDDIVKIVITFGHLNNRTLTISIVEAEEEGNE